MRLTRAADAARARRALPPCHPTAAAGGAAETALAFAVRCARASAPQDAPALLAAVGGDASAVDATVRAGLSCALIGRLLDEQHSDSSRARRRLLGCGGGAGEADAPTKRLARLLGPLPGSHQRSLSVICRAPPERRAVSMVGEALPRGRQLQRLRLSGVDGAVVTPHVCRTLAHGALRVLYMQRCALAPAEARALLGAVGAEHSLRRLDLGENLLKDGGAAVLGGWLRANRTLTLLDLRENRIGAKGVKALAEGVRAHPALAALDLARNDAGDEGAAALGAALRAHRTLAELSLRANRVADGGAAALAEGLKENSSLTRLVLFWNRIGPPGALALGGALAANRRLTELSLRSNRVGDAGADALALGLRANGRLATLNLRHNGLTGAAALALAGALQHNRALEHLDLR